MIYTASNKNLRSNKYRSALICGFSGNEYCYPDLFASPLKMIPNQDNYPEFITLYYKEILSKLDPEKIYQELDNSVLVGANNDYCHRFIIAEWFKLFLDVNVPDVIIDDDYFKIIMGPGNIREHLERAIKETIDLKGYRSIRAYQLSENAKLVAELSFGDEEVLEYANALKQQASSVERAYNIRAKNYSFRS